MTRKQHISYFHIRRVNPHIPAWRVLEYIKVFTQDELNKAFTN